MIPTTFINYAADILGETQIGLSGSKIAGYCSAYAIDYNVEIPYSEDPFPKNVQNKRTALRKNLQVFTPEQQFKIIKELCELGQFKESSSVKDLKIKLISRYGYLGTDRGTEKIGTVNSIV